MLEASELLTLMAEQKCVDGDDDSVSHKIRDGLCLGSMGFMMTMMRELLGHRFGSCFQNLVMEGKSVICAGVDRWMQQVSYFDQLRYFWFGCC